MAPKYKFLFAELNRLRRDCIAAILAAYVSYAGETPAVQIQIPIRSSYHPPRLSARWLPLVAQPRAAVPHAERAPLRLRRKGATPSRTRLAAPPVVGFERPRGVAPTSLRPPVITGGFKARGPQAHPTILFFIGVGGFGFLVFGFLLFFAFVFYFLFVFDVFEFFVGSGDNRFVFA